MVGEVTGALDNFRRVSPQPRSVQRYILKHSSQALYGPLVKQLGYEYSARDSVQTVQLRTRAITHAAMAEDPEYVSEI